AAHIDIVPTLLDACGVPTPAGLRLDGRSLLPLLRGNSDVAWPDRTLFFQWHRGDQPQRDRAFVARSQRYALLRREPPPESRHVPPLELYDMESDPYQQHDLAAKEPRIAAQMHENYLAWFDDVSSTRGFEPIRIAIGGAREDPTVLTRQDWRGPRSGW